MDNKFAAINALEAAREALREAQVLLADAEHRLLDEWVEEAELDTSVDHVCTHDCFVPNAFENDEPPSYPLPH